MSLGNGTTFKAEKTDVETYERDIICLPHDHPNELGLYSYPRGKVRTQLAKFGLIGKISLHSWMNEVEMKAEIRSFFSRAFGDDPFFPFKFLQSAGIGAKALPLVIATSGSQTSSHHGWSSGHLHLGWTNL